MIKQIIRGFLIAILVSMLFGLIGCFDNKTQRMVLPELLEAPSANPLNFPVRIFYVKDPEGIYLDGAEDQFLEAFRESQSFFSKEMERHGYGRRTFQLATDHIERIRTKHDQLVYGDKDPICTDTERPQYNRLLEELYYANRTVSEDLIYVFIIGFPLQCVGGLAYDSSFAPIILIDAYDDFLRSDVLSHEFGHVFNIYDHDERPHNFMNANTVEGEIDFIEADQAAIIDKWN